MPRKKNESRVLYARDVIHVYIAFVSLWSKDCIASITASPGLGDFGCGEMITKEGKVDTQDGPRSEWRFEFTSRPLTLPELTNTSSDEWEVMMSGENDVLGGQGLVRDTDAVAWLMKMFGGIKASCQVRAEQALLDYGPPIYNGAYRRWAHWSRCAVVADKLLYDAIEAALRLSPINTRKPRGPQRIDTTSPRIPPPMRQFKFNGRSAIRLARGRIPLPKSEWIRRYKLRLKKRNKTGRKRRDGRKLHVPKTKYGRPLRVIDPHNLKFDHRKLGPYFSKAEVDIEEIKRENE